MMKKFTIFLIGFLVLLCGCSSTTSYVGAWESLKGVKDSETGEKTDAYLVINEDETTSLLIGETRVDYLTLRKNDEGIQLKYGDISMDISINDSGNLVLDYPLKDDKSTQIEFTKGDSEKITAKINAVNPMRTISSSEAIDCAKSYVQSYYAGDYYNKINDITLKNWHYETEYCKDEGDYYSVTLKGYYNKVDEYGHFTACNHGCDHDFSAEISVSKNTQKQYSSDVTWANIRPTRTE